MYLRCAPEWQLKWAKAFISSSMDSQRLVTTNLSALSKLEDLRFLYSVYKSPCRKWGYPRIGVSGDSFVVSDVS